MITVFYCLIFSFIVSSILSNSMLRNADKFKRGKRVYAERVILHKKGVPRLGGLILYAVFYLSLFSLLVVNHNIFNVYKSKFFFLFFASSLIVTCGLYDDLRRRISYKIKFLIQFLSVVIVAFVYHIDVITNPFGGHIDISFLSIPLVILWMLTIMNAINLIDGLDGLACGISTIAGFGFLIIAYNNGSIFPAAMIATLIGASLAFLRYNFYPARLFLGDSGSLFLGFILGISALENSIKRTTVISLIVPILALFIPVTSILFTFSRRVASAKNPFKADRWHLHYRLLRAGLSHRNTVLAYYIVTAVYVVLGILCFFMPKKFELSTIIFAGLLMSIIYIWAVHHISLKKK